MKQITTTLSAYCFLLISSTNQIFGVSLYEEQILNLGKKYERTGDYKKALDIYSSYKSDNNAPSTAIEERIVITSELAKGQKDRPAPVQQQQQQQQQYREEPKKRAVKIQKNYSSSEGNYYAIQTMTGRISESGKRMAEQQKNRIEALGLKCYVKEGQNIYVRCNPSQNKNDLKNGIAILKRAGIDNFIVKDKNIPFQSKDYESKIQNSNDNSDNNEKSSLTDKPITTKLKSGVSKYTANDGYLALNSKQLSKAKEIFSDLLQYNDQDIDSSFGLALAFMNEGDWNKAYITLSKVIDLTDRTDIKKTYKTIEYNMNLKEGWKNVSTNPDKSIAYFTKAGEIEADSTDVAEGLSYAYNNIKDYDRVIPEVKKLFAKRKDFKSANMLIEAYLKAKQPDKANDFFDSLDPDFQINLDYNPKRDQQLLEIEGLIADGRYHQAKSLLRELYLMYPTNAKVLLSFAKVYESEKQYKSAIEYYETILSKDETNIDALEGLANIHTAQEKYDDALQYLAKLKAQNKDGVEKKINKIKLKLYIQQKRSKDALVLAKEMLLEEPTNLDLYLILGDLNMEMKKNRDAYFYYGRAFQLNQNSFDIRMKLLNLLLEQNLFDQTQTLLSKFEGFQMNDEQKMTLRDFYIKFYKKYTAVSLEEKDYAYALKGAKAGLQMEPNDSFFIESAGWAGLNSKKYNDAIYYFNKILAKDPENYTIRYGVGLAYVNLKQMDKAREYFQYAEKSSDIDLLYKVAEIYKDIGFKKDSYRVVKLIEELGRYSVGKSAKTVGNNGGTSIAQNQLNLGSSSSVTSGSTSRDSMDTYNPFIGNSSPPNPNSQTNSGNLQPVNSDSGGIEVKKKIGQQQWF